MAQAIRTAVAVVVSTVFVGACVGLHGGDLTEEPAARSARLEEVHRYAAAHARVAKAAALAASLAPRAPHLSPRERQSLAHWIVGAAIEADIDPYLLAAIVEAESHYQPHVVSSAGAVGLMQVLPRVAAHVAASHGLPWYGPQALRNPELNVRIGAFYLRELLDTFDGDLRLALAAYNMGPTALRQRLREGWLPTGPYARGVAHAYRHLCSDAKRADRFAALAGGERLAIDG